MQRKNIGVKNSLDLKVNSSPDSEVVSEAVLTFEQMISACPNPTQNELRKMLSVQGYILNNLGLKLMQAAAEGKFSPNKMQIALKALSSSREALKAAGAIKDFSETIEVSPD